jgi:hypothetical protein
VHLGFRLGCHVLKFLETEDIGERLSRVAARSDEGLPFRLDGTRAGPDVSLSDEAQELLIEAATDKSGHVLKAEYIGGSHIQTNGKTFGRGADARAWARWEFALDQLVSGGLLRSAGSKGQVFRVTNEGFELADRLRGGRQ